MRAVILTGAGLTAALADATLTGNAFAAQARYVCSGGTKLTAVFSPPSLTNGRVDLIFDSGRRMALPQVMAADGGRYAREGVEFWIKGRNATLTRDGQIETCSPP